MNPIHIAFSKEKETKGAVRYTEDPRDGTDFAVGTLYVRKFALGTPFPDKLEVTIETGVTV